MKTLIVGAGEMGRWFARTLESADESVSLAFADRDPDVARSAAGSLPGATTASLDGDDRYDLVCLAVPMSAAADAVAAHADRAEGAICDVTGAMGPSVDAMNQHATDLERVSLHPLFSATNAPGNVAAVVVQDGPTVGAIRRALAAAGNEVFETTPAVHDHAMETVQTKAHAAVLAFALAADPVPEEFATPVFADLADVVETVTGNDPGVYGEIQATFDGADEVAAAARRVAEADPEAFADLYREAGTPVDRGSETTDAAGGTDPDDDRDEVDP